MDSIFQPNIFYFKNNKYRNNFLNRNFSKFHIKTLLVSLCSTDSEVLTLFHLFESEYPINKVSEKGLLGLTKIIESANALGVKISIKINNLNYILHTIR